MVAKYIAFVKWGLLALDGITFLLVATVGSTTLTQILSHPIQWGTLLVAIILSLYACRCYDFESLSQSRKGESMFRVFIGSSVAVILVGIGTLYTVPNYLRILSKIEFATIWLGFASIASLARWIISKGLRYLLPCKRAIIVGQKAKWHPIMMEISEKLVRKLLPVAYCEPNEKSIQEAINLKGQTQIIILADSSFSSEEGQTSLISALRHKGIETIFLPELAEKYLGRIPHELLMEYSDYYHICLSREINDKPQRISDILAGLVGMTVGMILMIPTAIAVAASSGFPVIFTQRRIGKDGRIYTLHKFRSMTKEKPQEAAFANQEQSRITKVGRFIRKTRLDELPQFWDVLTGSMSLIGPRPEQPEFVKSFREEIPFYEYRHRIRPGITGWAQINFTYAADVTETRKKLEYDLYYVKNRSLLLNLQIGLKTVETMLGMRGAR
ncbi:exopolysaccharide biosynthesis polyprenyl glycosylphosphotransferase [Dethiosulfovibrio salsuginis]|uniref:Exopolysaccharide biosynthesis polyprenyl glycosylphosphotransferase n=1 Tax=Dethiosulfovibrio salsuginis TaxID=561720 RepID=A0A1X7INQ1_9BACT|nr:exopolysaccharide biosynthesis polyprenyl glycosylphosphotransferase [Dethiosulfovibrio salsuginis]